MNINKKTAVTILSVSFLVISFGAALSTSKILPKIADAKSINYSLTLDKNNDCDFDDEGYSYGFLTKTNNNNLIEFKTLSLYKIDNKLGRLDDHGYISNLSPINGLKSISIDIGEITEGLESEEKTNSIDIIWGWYEVEDFLTPLSDYSKRFVTENDSIINFDFNNDAPSYFAIYSKTDCIEINSITLNYSCEATEAPDTYGYEFEVNEDSCCIVDFGLNKELNPVLFMPSEYKGLPVTGIDENAFHNNEYLTIVYLPDDLIYIGRNAFQGCSSLEMVIIPASLQFIGGDSEESYSNAFADCPNLKAFSVDPNNEYFTFTLGGLLRNYNNDLKLTTLITATNEFFDYPSDTLFVYTSVQSVGKYAFYGFNKKDIVLSQDCLEICEYAFGDMPNIKRIFLPSSIVRIDANAVQNLPSSVQFYTDASEEEVANKSWNCSKIKDNLLYGYNNNFEKNA